MCIRHIPSNSGAGYVMFRAERLAHNGARMEEVNRCMRALMPVQARRAFSAFLQCGTLASRAVDRQYSSMMFYIGQKRDWPARVAVPYR